MLRSIPVTKSPANLVDVQERPEAKQSPLAAIQNTHKTQVNSYRPIID